jgi:hypothetical protein
LRYSAIAMAASRAIANAIRAMVDVMT